VGPNADHWLSPISVTSMRLSGASVTGGRFATGLGFGLGVVTGGSGLGEGQDQVGFRELEAQLAVEALHQDGLGGGQRIAGPLHVGAQFDQQEERTVGIGNLERAGGALGADALEDLRAGGFDAGAGRIGPALGGWGGLEQGSEHGDFQRGGASVGARWGAVLEGSPGC
jgi:hypothetical protein